MFGICRNPIATRAFGIDVLLVIGFHRGHASSSACQIINYQHLCSDLPTVPLNSRSAPLSSSKKPYAGRVRASHYAHPVCALRRFQPATWKLAQCKSVANTSNNMAVTNLARKPSWIASCCSVKQADHRENGALAEKAEEGRAWGQQSIVGHQKGTQAPHCCFAPFEELAAPGPENRCGQSGMPSANQICQPPHLHRIIQDHHE